MAKLAAYMLGLAAGREERAQQLPDAKYSYLFKRAAKSAQGRNGINGGDPRSGEEAVYAGFGLEQTQRSARREELTMPPLAIKLSQEPDLQSFLKRDHNRNLLGFIYGPHDKDLITYTSYAMILQADNLTSLDKVIKFGLPASFADIKNRSIQFRSDMPGMFNPQS